MRRWGVGVQRDIARNGRGRGLYHYSNAVGSFGCDSSSVHTRKGISSKRSILGGGGGEHSYIGTATRLLTTRAQPIAQWR